MIDNRPYRRYASGPSLAAVTLRGGVLDLRLGVAGAAGPHGALCWP